MPFQRMWRCRTTLQPRRSTLHSIGSSFRAEREESSGSGRGRLVRTMRIPCTARNGPPNRTSRRRPRWQHRHRCSRAHPRWKERARYAAPWRADAVQPAVPRVTATLPVPQWCAKRDVPRCGDDKRRSSPRFLWRRVRAPLPLRWCVPPRRTIWLIEQTAPASRIDLTPNVAHHALALVDAPPPPRPSPAPAARQLPSMRPDVGGIEAAVTSDHVLASAAGWSAQARRQRRRCRDRNGGLCSPSSDRT